jgi:hypothetical protein
LLISALNFSKKKKKRINMLTIYKWAIPIEDHFTLELPKNARILTIQTQRNTPQLWAMVDSETEKETRHFRLSDS